MKNYYIKLFNYFVAPGTAPSEREGKESWYGRNTQPPPPPTPKKLILIHTPWDWWKESIQEFRFAALLHHTVHTSPFKCCRNHSFKHIHSASIHSKDGSTVSEKIQRKLKKKNHTELHVFFCFVFLFLVEALRNEAQIKRINKNDSICIQKQNALSSDPDETTS